jgi:hypothetical protein
MRPRDAATTAPSSGRTLRWSSSSPTGPWRTFLSAWEDLGAEAEEYRELDSERVLVLVRWSGRGKTSGLELEQMRAKGAGLFHISGGKVTRQVVYFDRVRAFADLGLAPDASSSRS